MRRQPAGGLAIAGAETLQRFGMRDVQPAATGHQQFASQARHALEHLHAQAGLRQVANICYQRAHYAASEIAKLDGFEVVANGPFFHEFVVRCPRPVAEIDLELEFASIIGGYDLKRDYPQLGDAMLLCVTEMNAKEDIDRLVAALKG